ncbi:cupin domain-containing protein [Nitriliruptoraceae bacterium ZYF776]|nr:cupin domain-containing protein [Profundirhabdus halotolerans]
MRNADLYGRVVRFADLPVDRPRPGVERVVYATDEVMLAWHTLEVGMAANPHHHDEFDQLVLILAGRCRYHVDGVPLEMGPGSVTLVPAGATHHIEPTEGPCVNLDVFVPPRADLLHLVADLGVGAGS